MGKGSKTVLYICSVSWCSKVWTCSLKVSKNDGYKLSHRKILNTFVAVYFIIGFLWTWNLVFLFSIHMFNAMKTFFVFEIMLLLREIWLKVHSVCLILIFSVVVDFMSFKAVKIQLLIVKKEVYWTKQNK